MPNGPSENKPDFAGRVMVASAAHSVGAADVAVSTLLTSGHSKRIHCNEAGNLFLKLDGDAGFTQWVVTAGQDLDVSATDIGGTTNNVGATAGLDIIVLC